MKDTSLRRIETLRLVPQAPHSITTAELVEQLRSLGYEVGQRSVQRDLIELSSIFPLQCTPKGKKNDWHWIADAEILDLPSMNPHTALSFFLAEQYLYEMMPPSAIDALEPHFNRAKIVLRKSQFKTVDEWIDKIQILPEAMPLLSPSLNQQIIDVIYTALLEGKAFSAEYQRRGQKELTSYEAVNPLGLVFRHRVVYLIATLWEYNDPIQFALHRFKSAEINEEAKYRRPDGFNLDEYIKQGNFDYILGNDINIELLFDKSAAEHLLETPLSENQQVSHTKDGRVRVKARVKNSDRLRWWLHGFREYVEVVKPATLRKEFADSTKKLANMYKGTT